MEERRRVDRVAIVIAFLVAVVSIVSALVAGRAAVWASTAGALDATILQEAIERQQLEGDREADANADVRLAVRYDDAVQRALALSRAATDLRPTDPAGAARLDLDAQAAWGVDLVLWRFFRLQVPAYDADGHLVLDMTGAVDAQLAVDPRLQELRRSQTPALAADAHRTTTTLVGIAVLFVAALFVFTLGEIWRGRRRWVPLVVGVGIALAGVAATIAVDPDTALLLGLVVLGAAIVLVVVLVAEQRRDGGARTAAGVTDPTEAALVAEAAAGEAMGGTMGEAAAEPMEAEALEVDGSEGRSDRFRSVVAIALATATLLGAGVGYLQGSANDESAAATAEAQDHALAALTERSRATDRAGTAIEVWSKVEEDRARAAGAEQAATYLDGVGDAAGAAAARAGADLDLAAATAADAITDLSDDHPDGPRADPGFPDRYLVRAQQASADRTIRQDLANEASSAWSGRAAAYVAILATVAIAAYLFGLTLVLKARRQRTMFAVVGVGLVIAAAAGALVVALSPTGIADEATTDQVAEAFVKARVASLAARTPEDRQAAVDAYREVIRLHPSLARAHAELATALFAAGSPQTSGYQSIASPDAVRAAIAELETARSLGRDDVGTRGWLGFDRLLLSLADPSGGAAARAVEETARALELAPDLPSLGFTHAAALLAAGRVEEARTAYADAIALLTGRDEAGAARFGPSEIAANAAGALTDLGLVTAARADDPAIAAAGPELRATIVAGTGDPIPAAAADAPARVSGLSLGHDASRLWWLARIDDLDPARDALSVVWSAEDPATPGWHVLPAISGPLRPGQRTAAGTLQANGAPPDWFGSAAYLLTSDPHACVPAGRYRVELFLNGRLAADPVTQDVEGAGLAVEDRPDLGLLFCRPDGWTATNEQTGRGVTFQDAEGRPVMLVTRVNRAHLDGAAGDAEVAAVLDGIAAAWPGAPAVTDGSAPVAAPFLGLAHGQVQWYDGPDGRLKVVGGMTDLGTVIAVALAGTPDWVDGAEANGIVSSIIRR
ncbi:MAG: tetratricopeptide repeat protein [Chloroflexota bacterium]